METIRVVRRSLSGLNFAFPSTFSFLFNAAVVVAAAEIENVASSFDSYAVSHGDVTARHLITLEISHWKYENHKMKRLQ